MKQLSQIPGVCKVAGDLGHLKQSNVVSVEHISSFFKKSMGHLAIQMNSDAVAGGLFDHGRIWRQILLCRWWCADDPRGRGWLNLGCRFWGLGSGLGEIVICIMMYPEIYEHGRLLWRSFSRSWALGKIPYCFETGCWFGMMDVQCIGFLKMLDDLLIQGDHGMNPPPSTISASHAVKKSPGGTPWRFTSSRFFLWGVWCDVQIGHALRANGCSGWHEGHEGRRWIWIHGMWGKSFGTPAHDPKLGGSKRNTRNICSADL